MVERRLSGTKATKLRPEGTLGVSESEEASFRQREQGMQSPGRKSAWTSAVRLGGVQEIR